MQFGFHVTKNNKLFCHVNGPSKPSHYINYASTRLLSFVTGRGESKSCSRENVLLWKIILQNILVHTRIIKIQMLNCYCQLSSSVIFRQYGVSQSECKIDRPRPGLPRVSPRPHTEALGTRLSPHKTEACHAGYVYMVYSLYCLFFWGQLFKAGLALTLFGFGLCI